MVLCILFCIDALQHAWFLALVLRLSVCLPGHLFAWPVFAWPSVCLAICLPGQSVCLASVCSPLPAAALDWAGKVAAVTAALLSCIAVAAIMQLAWSPV